MVIGKHLTNPNFRIFPIFISLVALVAIMGCGAKHPATEAPYVGPSVKLPNGTVLTLKSISLGNYHKEPFETSRAYYRTPNSSLALWTYLTAPPDNKKFEDVYLTVADESGFVHLPPGIGSYSMLTTNWFGDRMEYNPFKAFPRRATNLTFYIHTVTNSGWIIVGSFTIPNPAHGSFPVWQPESLPATRTNDNMQFTLTSLRVRTNTPPDADTEATFSITSNGVPATDWQVESLQLSDATDNLLDLWSGDRLCAVVGNGLFCATNRWLGLDEPAWKLHAEFSHQAGYSTDELVTITNVPTKLGAYTPNESSSATLKDATIDVQKITSEFNGSWGDNNATVEVSVIPKPDHFRIALIKVTNERGQEIEVTKNYRDSGNFMGYNGHSFGLKLPANTKSLNLTFAYQESRFADFTVKPAIASAQ